MAGTFSTQPLIDPRILAGDLRADASVPLDWWGLPNRFTCPLGGEPGYGWVILARQSLDALDLNTPHDLTIVSRDTSVTLKNLLVVKARALNPSNSGHPGTAYLCEIADRRRLWRMVPVNKEYNVRDEATSASYLSSTKNGAAAWTWDEMAEDLWDAVGQLGAWPGLPYTPDGTPENFRFSGWRALEALSEVLERVGCALKLNPHTEAYSVVRVGAADALTTASVLKLDNKGLRVWDDYPVEPAQALIPEKVRVHFSRMHETCPAAGAPAFHFIDKTDPDGTSAGVVAGTHAMLFDDLPALYDSTPTLLNTSDLDARAADRAAEYFRRARSTRLTERYAGYHAIAPGSLIKAVTWVDAGDEGGAVTEITRVPGMPVALPKAGGAGRSAAASPQGHWEDGTDLGLWQSSGRYGAESLPRLWTYLSYLSPSLKCSLNSISGGSGSGAFSGTRVSRVNDSSVTTSTDIIFDTVEYDTDSYVDAGNKSWTIPADGKYLVTAWFEMTAFESSDTMLEEEIEVWITRPSDPAYALTVQKYIDSIGTGSTVKLTATGVAAFEAGDTITIVAYFTYDTAPPVSAIATIGKRALTITRLDP